MRFKRVLWVLMYVTAAVIPSFLYVIKATDINSDFIFLLSGVLGITAYTLLSIQFLITSRPKLIDKYFSLDRLLDFI